MESDRVLSGLTAIQQVAVRTDAQPLCILAGAGAGKTRVLTRRITYRVAAGTADPGHVLALTFTRRAAREMAGRLGQLGIGSPVAAGTFHGIAYAQLRQYWADRGERPPTLLERKSRLVAELLQNRPRLADAPVDGLVAEIEWAHARLVPPDLYGDALTEMGRPAPVAIDAMTTLYARYEVEKRRRRLIDYDDLLSRCIAAMETEPVFAAAQRWRWRHVFVDEFQDINPLQHRLLLAWLGGRLDLCVVGDPNQAIYGWNGADPQLLQAMQRWWPSTTVLRLEDNHRCTPQVVSAAAAVLGQAGLGLRSSRSSGRAPRVRRYHSARAEADGVAIELWDTRARGLAWRDLAVLFRTNAQAGLFEEALRAAGVPYRVSRLSASADAPTEVGDDRESVPGEGPADAVTLSTFHRAKGLEWKVVWVTGLEQGLVPIGYATTSAGLEEERRLLYVALTRAALMLHCSWAEERSFAARPIPREPSPWLEPLARAAAEPPHESATRPAEEQSSADGAAVGAVTTARARLAGRRSHRGETGRLGPGDADDAVLEALRAWRARAARASGVPPYVLFHDRTLDALAWRRPSTAEELLAVPGLGPVKVARYGSALLDLVANHGATA